jgi:AbrB family looped-hinge helix DNA binding protein
MTYHTTITQKGQILIPVELRKILELKVNEKLILEIGENRQEIILKSAVDILDLAGSLSPKRKISSLKAREKFEKNYERI